MRILTKLKQFSHTLETSIEANLYRREHIYQQITKHHQATLHRGHYDA